MGPNTEPTYKSCNILFPTYLRSFNPYLITLDPAYNNLKDLERKLFVALGVSF